MKFCEFADINPKEKLQKNEEYFFVEMTDIVPGNRFVYPKKKKYKGGGSKFTSGDVLFARITPCLENGKIAQIKVENNTKCFGSTEFFVFRAKKDISDQDYIFYLAYSDIIRKPAEKSMYGASGRQRADLNAVKNIEIASIPLPTQRKIASILSTYDELIENNTRRIKILEEMAQRIYREWFVDFRFPGHEKVRFIDSELGRIPEGWEVKKIGEVIQYYIGGGWGKERLEGKYSVEAYVIRGTDIPNVRRNNTSSCPLRFHTLSNFKNRKIKEGDIIFEVSGGSKDQPVGRSLLVNQKLFENFSKPVICASFCKLMRVNQDIISPEIFYLKLVAIYEDRSIRKYQVQSTGISNFKFEYFLNNETIVCPIDAVQKEFSEIVGPFFDEMSLLGQKNMKLRETRDLLLPKLISGEIDVSKMDIELEKTINNSEESIKDKVYEKEV